MTTTSIEILLERNGRFAEAGRHEGAAVIPNLRLMLITCLDPRVDPARTLGLELSEAIVVRNLGGRVGAQTIDEVAFIGQIFENVVPEGPLFEVAVIHHTQCGAAALADENFRRSYAERIGAEESSLRDIAVIDPAETVAGDVERLRSAAPIPSRVAVSGHVYDVVTGLMRTVVPAEPAPALPAT
jgi:carbonic anhydrase